MLLFPKKDNWYIKPHCVGLKSRFGTSKLLLTGFVATSIAFLFNYYLQLDQTYFNFIQSIDKLRFGIEKTHDVCELVNKTKFSTFEYTIYFNQLLQINQRRDDFLMEVVQQTKKLHMQKIITNQSYLEVKKFTRLADKLSKANIKVCGLVDIPSAAELAHTQDKIIEIVNQSKRNFFPWMFNFI